MNIRARESLGILAAAAFIGPGDAVSQPPIPTSVLGAENRSVEQREQLPAAVAPPSATLLPSGAATIRDYSWILIEKPRPRPIRVHDLITITVDDKSEVFIDQRRNRSRIGQLQAELAEFIRFGDGGRLLNAAANSPTIDANLQGRLNSQGQTQASEGIKYKIAATIVDIRPNGNLILEARKTVDLVDEQWEYRLTGEIRPEKVNRDFTASSEDIANLQIDRDPRGGVFEVTKRPWGVRIFDKISPF